MKQLIFTIRQGDVALIRVSKLPEGLSLSPHQERKIVLALGEATGHHHRIEDHAPALAIDEQQAWAEAGRVIAKAKLWQAQDGSRYLEVTETVTLQHEEHTAHEIPPGIYHLPRQVEYTPSELRRVAD